MSSAREFQVRMQMLDMDRYRIEQQYKIAKAQGAPNSVLLFIIKERAYIQGRLDECKAYVETSVEAEPRYGEVHRVDGVLVPKLPTFGSPEAIEEALRTREGTPEYKPKEIAAAREWRHRHDAQEQARLMDGHSPFVPEEERKPMGPAVI